MRRNSSKKSVLSLYLLFFTLFTVTVLCANQAKAFTKEQCPSTQLEKDFYIGKLLDTYNFNEEYISTNTGNATYMFTAISPTDESVQKSILTNKGKVAKIHYTLEQSYDATNDDCKRQHKIIKVESVPQNTALTAFDNKCSKKVFSTHSIQGIFDGIVQEDQTYVNLTVDGKPFSIAGSAESMFGAMPKEGDKVSLTLSFERFWNGGWCAYENKGTAGKILKQ